MAHSILERVAEKALDSITESIADLRWDADSLARSRGRMDASYATGHASQIPPDDGANPVSRADAPIRHAKRIWR
jgi:hypothetical protein